MSSDAIGRRTFIAAALGLSLPAFVACAPAEARRLPAPTDDGAAVAAANGLERAVLAGGCFWGVQAVFAHVKGVRRSISGYTGGHVRNPSYQAVSRGDTGHAESVEIMFDPKVISYGEILQIFFSVATDPTQLNRQGPDVGTQYRNEIFYTSPEQKRVAERYIAQLGSAGLFSRPIVTKVSALTTFYRAEDYHQDYLFNNPNEPYIVINDMPKLADLRESFPQDYLARPVRVAQL